MEMEEELNEHELEERLYAMLHHVDETQSNLNTDQQNKNHADLLFENGPRSTIRRYWHTDAESNVYQKINTPRKPAAVGNNTSENVKAKDEQCLPQRPLSPADLTILQSPVPQIVQKTIQYIEHEDEAVVLESSDEDEVVEVALPPKPTITIESSDDELVGKADSPTKTKTKSKSDPKQNSGERDISSSPVPSVVSSVSDEFIRGDCIALNISSRQPDKHSFDFSLHGSDLVVQNTSKKKKRKKNKEVVTSTPIVAPVEKPASAADGCFATPKSKAKNKRQKSKLFPEITMPAPDVYDSDSNQSIDTNKNNNPYIVTSNSLPNIDVYESDSNQSEVHRETNKDKSNMVSYEVYSDSSVTNNGPKEATKNAKRNTRINSYSNLVDLTQTGNYTLDRTKINESIVMANVTGFSDHGDEIRELSYDISKFVSSKTPSILNENLDFDHLKGKDSVCRIPYSPKTFQAEMEKFYNESWGGENFNHREIQKNMSRDRSLWAIDAKDRMPSLAQRRTKCNYCNRVGHRDDTCRQKPPVCYMCGRSGHLEPRCPYKICLNCGSPHFMYSSMCRKCSAWPKLRCAECGAFGHPASHCPDLWRRYHNTTSSEVPLEMVTQHKKQQQQHCSGCSRRGHLVHACRTTLPFSGLPLNSPFVQHYRPIFNSNTGKPRSKSFSQDMCNRDTSHKRLSKSPTTHETHAPKKRNLSLDERPDAKTASPVQRPKEDIAKKKALESTSVNTTEAPIDTPNRDNEGHLIQDNEVSDTSDVVTSARIYVTNDIITKLKTMEGEDWLKASMEQLHVNISHSDVNSFLTIKGKLADQEAFQSQLRDWSSTNTKPQNESSVAVEETDKGPEQLNLPKSRCQLLRKLTQALDKLNQNLGDPQALYKELLYSENKHEKMMKQKVISPLKLSKNRSHINDMLTRLNTILLGQAGLADGSEHVNELQSYREKLTNSRQKHISSDLRKQIARHYYRIFTSSARDDYSDLIKIYYSSTPKLVKKRKKNKRPKPISANVQEQNSIPAEEKHEPVKVNVAIKNGQVNRPDKSMLPKLIFYHQRLQSAKSPQKAKIKQKRLYIMRKVQSLIHLLFKNEFVTSKITKKIKRAQAEAQKFLSEV